MKCAVLQPAYLPWLGYFDLLHKVDIFVFLDDVQMTIRDWRTRNRVRTKSGWKWLTVPIDWNNRSYRDFRVCDVGTKGTDWLQKHLNILHEEYREAPYLEDVTDLIRGTVEASGDNLSLIDRNLTVSIANYIGLNCLTFDSSKLRSKVGEKSEGLLQIIDTLRNLDYKIETYLSGPAAKDYLDESLFTEKDVRVEWHNYKHPYYNHPYEYFISHLSIIDLLMYHKHTALDIITGKITVERPEDMEVVTADDYRHRV